MSFASEFMRSAIDERINRLAELLWEVAGRPPGRDEEFWKLAEEFVRGQ